MSSNTEHLLDDQDELNAHLVAVENQIDDIPDNDMPVSIDPNSDAPVPSAAAVAAASELGEPQKNTVPAMGGSGDAPLALDLESRDGFGHKLKRLFKNWKFWVVMLFFVVASSALVWFLQPSRLLVMRAIGLTTQISVQARTPAEEGQESAAIKNAMLEVNGQKYVSDDKGNASITLPYGQHSLKLSKAGYTSATKDFTLDYDPFFYYLGGKAEDEAARAITAEMQIVGLSVSFTTKDWLTDQPLTAGEFHVGDISAKPNDQGLVVVKVPATDAKTVKISAKFNGTHADKQFEVPLSAQNAPATQPPQFTFTPAGKHYFLSKRSGKLTFYGSNIDGTETAELIVGTGGETGDTHFAVNPKATHAVVVSARDGKRDAVGNALQKLYIVDLKNPRFSAVDEARSFVLADWSDDSIMYTAATGTSAKPTYRLSALNVTNSQRADLSAQTKATFGEVRVSMGQVLYTIRLNEGESGAANNPELRVVSVKGGSEKNLGYKVNNLSQQEYDAFVYQADGSWHAYNLNTGELKSSTVPAGQARTFLTATGANGQQRLVLDKLDGVPVLLSKSVASGEEKRIFSHSGLRGPIRWLNASTVVVRVVDGSQSADYAISLATGSYKKITDVSAPPPSQTLQFAN